MKLQIDLDAFTLDDWGTTVAAVIKDEVTSSVRNIVKAEMKNHKEEIARETAKILRPLIADLKYAKLADVVKAIQEQLK
jgi:hypothetical protein